MGGQQKDMEMTLNDRMRTMERLFYAMALAIIVGTILMSGRGLFSTPGI